MIFGPAQTISFFKTRWMKVGPRGVVCFFLGITMVMYSGIHPVSAAHNGAHKARPSTHSLRGKP